MDWGLPSRRDAGMCTATIALALVLLELMELCARLLRQGAPGWRTPGEGGWGWANDRRGGDSTRQLQLAVNIIIYALTQEGSLTQRLMQMVN